MAPALSCSAGCQALHQGGSCSASNVTSLAHLHSTDGHSRQSHMESCMLMVKLVCWGLGIEEGQHCRIALSMSFHDAPRQPWQKCRKRQGLSNNMGVAMQHLTLASFADQVGRLEWNLQGSSRWVGFAATSSASSSWADELCMLCFCSPQLMIFQPDDPSMALLYNHSLACLLSFLWPASTSDSVTALL